MKEHAHLPTTIKLDKGSVLKSQMVKQMAEVLRNRLQHDKTKHAQPIAMLEQPHASFKTSNMG